MIDIQEAKYDGDYRIWLKFSSGEEGVVDLADIVARYPAVRPLLDKAAFKQFVLNTWLTLAWSCGLLRLRFQHLLASRGITVHGDITDFEADLATLDTPHL